MARIDRVRLRWAGHRLQGDALVAVTADADAEAIAADVERTVRAHLRKVDDFVVTARGLRMLDDRGETHTP